MDITFNVLHAFQPGSNPAGNDDVRRILHDCLVRLNRAHSTNGIGPARYWVNGRLVVWTLPYFGPENTYEENSHGLSTLLNCLIDLNLSYLRFGANTLGPRIPTLYDSPVYYKRTQVWDTLPALYQRGYGDCKSLSAALIAQYRTQGVECVPVFRFVPRQNKESSLDYHILVQTAVEFEDPSKIKGMGLNEVSSIHGLEG